MNCSMPNLESHIAWRYLFSKKGHNAINIVSGISAVAVAVVTAAMVCVLSVMNGFGALVEKMFSEFDPVLMVVSAEGQTLRTDTLPIASLYAREDIEAVSMQLEQTALVRYKDHQQPARILGVDSLFSCTAHIDSIITDRYYSVWDGAFDRAVLGRGLAAQIGINAHFTGALHLYAPKRTERINLLRPDLSLNHEHTFIAGTFAVNQIEYDDQLMLVSLPLAQRLFDYDEYTASALRIALKDPSKIKNLKSEISEALGPGYKVLDRYEQQLDFFRILGIEKLLTFLLLVFILLIAGFNIISSLSMLIIDKREDSQILTHLGADETTIRRIFLLEGWLISALGTLTGLVLGVLICLGQQHFGWLKLGSGAEYVISTYPVLVQWTDIVLVAVIVLALGFIVAWYPSHKMSVKAVGMLAIIGLFGLSSCKKTEPAPQKTLPATYTTAYCILYGQYYDSIPLDVVCLDLYAGGLDMDSTRHLKGSGYNLCLSDIFVADSLLAEGTYTSDSVAKVYTFLPGKDYEGVPNGAYLLEVEEGKIQQIQILDSGSFVYRHDSLLFTLYYNQGTRYETSFGGPLILQNHE